MTQLAQASYLCHKVGKNNYHAECLLKHIKENYDFRNAYKTENYGYFEWLLVDAVRSAMRRKNKPKKRRR